METPLWLAILAFIAASIWSLWDRIIAAKKAKTDGRTADQVRNDAQTALVDKNLHELVVALQAECARNASERQLACEGKAKAEQGVEARNKEIKEWESLSANLEKILERKKLEIFLYRRDRREMLKVTEGLESLLGKRQIDGKVDLQDCIQVVSMLIAKLHMDVHIPEKYDGDGDIGSNP